MFLIYWLIYGNLFIYGFTSTTTESVGAVCLGSRGGLAVFMPAPCLPHYRRMKKKKYTKHLASSPSNTALYTTSLKQECMCVMKGWLAIYHPKLWLVRVCMKLKGCTQAEALGQISNNTICLLPRHQWRKARMLVHLLFLIFFSLCWLVVDFVFHLFLYSTSSRMLFIYLAMYQLLECFGILCIRSITSLMMKQ